MKRIALTAVLLFCTLAGAQDTIQKRSYSATYTTTPPVIDGSIEDDAWLSGTWQGDFTQFEPVNGAAPSRKQSLWCFLMTTISMSPSRPMDSPDSIVRRISRRDNGDGDFVGIGFDSYHDRQTGFAFTTNVAGVKNDFIWSATGRWKMTPGTLYGSPGQRCTTGDGRQRCVYRSPSSGSGSPTEGSGAWRSSPDLPKQEMSVWQHIDRNSSGLVHNFGNMTGLTGIKPRKQADITPFVVGSLETFESEEGNPFSTGRAWKYNGGLDAKFGITNNMTLDLTVNPDFGQVEADPSEVNLTAYETFFEEKRPFFIEGNNITSFRTGLGDGDLGFDNLFYSRRIGRSPHMGVETDDNEYASIPRVTPIIGAAKVTGKTPDGLSVGIVEAVTAEGKAEIDNMGERSWQTVEPLYQLFGIQSNERFQRRQDSHRRSIYKYPPLSRGYRN